MWNWIKGLLGNYQGQQITKPLAPIVPNTKPATVNNILQIPAIWECVTKITRSMSGLPIDILRKIDDEGNVIYPVELSTQCIYDNVGFFEDNHNALFN